MCDKGILELVPDAMKLEYCITIMPELQQRIVSKISELISKEVVITNPTQGKYPEEMQLKNTVIVEVVDSEIKPYNKEVVRFSLKELSGCCGILVSFNTSVSKTYQGKGINSFLQDVKEEIAKFNGYTVLMCTVTSQNLPEIHILEKYGWKRTFEFTNKRTTNTVITYMKNLETN